MVHRRPADRDSREQTVGGGDAPAVGARAKVTGTWAGLVGHTVYTRGNLSLALFLDDQVTNFES